MAILKGVKNEVWQNCTAELPTDKDNRIVVTFKCLFERLKKSDYQSLLKNNDGKNGRPSLSDAIRPHLKDWKLEGQGGVEVPFNEEYLDEVFDDIDYAEGVVNGFLEVHFKQFKELTRKN